MKKEIRFVARDSKSKKYLVAQTADPYSNNFFLVASLSRAIAWSTKTEKEMKKAIKYLSREIAEDLGDGFLKSLEIIEVKIETNEK